MAKRNRARDDAKAYREKIIGLYAGMADPWSIPGLRHNPNERVLFVQMLKKERAIQVLNRVTKVIAGRHRTSYGVENAVLELPTGEKLCGWQFARYGSSAKEREVDFSTDLEHDARLLVGAGPSMGRLIAWFEGEGAKATLVCSDGRQMSQGDFRGRPWGREEE